MTAWTHESVEVGDCIIESYNIYLDGMWHTRWGILRLIDGDLISLGWRESKAEALAVVAQVRQ